MWLDGAFELVTSPRLLAELRRVLVYPRIRSRVDQDEAEAFLRLLERAATVVDDPDEPPSVPTQDPDDDYLVALAEASRALLVSGDNHLLRMAGRIPVYAPADFLAFLDARGGA